MQFWCPTWFSSILMIWPPLESSHQDESIGNINNNQKIQLELRQSRRKKKYRKSEKHGIKKTVGTSCINISLKSGERALQNIRCSDYRPHGNIHFVWIFSIRMWDWYDCGGTYPILHHQLPLTDEDGIWGWLIVVGLNDANCYGCC